MSLIMDTSRSSKIDIIYINVRARILIQSRRKPLSMTSETEARLISLPAEEMEVKEEMVAMARGVDVDAMVKSRAPMGVEPMENMVAMVLRFCVYFLIHRWKCGEWK
jgi:hypothetical protein